MRCSSFSPFSCKLLSLLGNMYARRACSVGRGIRQLFLLQQEKPLIDVLPRELLVPLMESLHLRKLNKFPLFAGLHEDIMFKICYVLHPQFVVRHEVIYSQQDPSVELYLVASGEV